MDQAQLDNFMSLQELSQQFLKDGFIQDHSGPESQIPQSMLAIPAVQ